MPDADPRFRIPSHPEPVSRPDGAFEYRGGTVFRLTPDPGLGADAVETLVGEVLAADPYTAGDWFGLPAPVYLVHDRETGDVFRVVVRGGGVELHVLPNTGSAGLRALYRRLQVTGDVTWTVECRTEER